MYADETNTTDAEFSTAVLYLHDGKLAAAASTIDRILESEPGNRQAQELHGMILQRQERWGDAAATFEKLLATDGAQPAYAFEAGVARLKAGQLDPARRHLEKAAAAKFNAESARYFLAVIDYQQGRLGPANAEFTELSRSTTREIRQSAMLYSGLIASAEGRERDAYRSFQNVQEILDGVKPSTPADRAGLEQMRIALQQARTGATSAFSAQVALLGGYDSNSILTPRLDEATSGAPTGVGGLSYGLGAWERLSRHWQVLGFYQGGINLHSNTAARSAQFILQAAGLSFLKDEGRGDGWGVHIESYYVLRNGLNGDDSFQAQQLSVAVAPFLKSGLGKGRSWTTELVLQPQKFFYDPDLTDSLRKTGYEARLRGIYGSDTQVAWPLRVDVSAYYQHTVGDEYRAFGSDLLLSNRLVLTDSLTVRPRLGLGVARYPGADGGARNDVYGQAATDLRYAWNKTFTAFATVSFIYNASSHPDLYQYQRAIAQGGVEALF